MFYDAHCHLQDARLLPYRAEILATLEEIGVARVVVNGTRESDWPDVLDLETQSHRVISSIGLHPWFLKERSPEWAARMENLKPRALGEIGLDRWIPDYDSADQEDVFVQQLRLAVRLDKAVSMHCLKAWGRLLEILSTEPLPKKGFLLHSYGGPAEMIDSFCELGAYFSISGYFAHSRKFKQREVFKRVPIERFLIETDAPDMLPPAELVEFSLPAADLNHPANVRAIYGFAAELRGLPQGRLQDLIEENFQRLFF